MDPKAAALLMSVFPTFAKDGDVALGEGGLTMRDYFAAKALPQVMAQNPNWGDLMIAECAYSIADAMLRARGAE